MDLTIDVWLGIWVGVGCPILGAIPPLMNARKRQVRIIWTIAQAVLAVGVTRALSLPWGDGQEAVNAELLHPDFWLRGTVWELGALMGVVLGGALRGRPLQPWLVAVGYGLHNPISAGLVGLFWGVAVTLFRRSQQAWWIALLLIPAVTILRSPYDQVLIVITGLFSAVLYFASQISEGTKGRGRSRSETSKGSQSSQMARGRTIATPNIPDPARSSDELKLFRDDGGVAKFGDALSPLRAGQPAAFLSDLLRDGYSVPETWVIMPGDDLEPVIAHLQPSRQHPVQISYSSLRSTDYAEDTAGTQWEAMNPGDFRGTIVKAFDRSQEPVVLMVRSKLWAVFAGTVRQVMPGYWLVTVGAERFEVRSDGTISGEGSVPSRLIQEVTILFQTIQQQYVQQIQHQFGRSIVLEWQHDGETLWISSLR